MPKSIKSSKNHLFASNRDQSDPIWPRNSERMQLVWKAPHRGDFGWTKLPKCSKLCCAPPNHHTNPWHNCQGMILRTRQERQFENHYFNTWLVPEFKTCRVVPTTNKRVVNQRASKTWRQKDLAFGQRLQDVSMKSELKLKRQDMPRRCISISLHNPQWNKWISGHLIQAAPCRHASTTPRSPSTQNAKSPVSYEIVATNSGMWRISRIELKTFLRRLLR